MSCVSALLRAFGPFARHWADTPRQNRRSRRCGGGLEHVPLPHTSPVRTEGREHGPCLPSRPCVTSQHHVGVFTRTWPPRLSRPPGMADAMIEAHIRFTEMPYPQRSDFTLIEPKWVRSKSNNRASLCGV